jgi:dynein heavy chain, axonemal
MLLNRADSVPFEALLFVTGQINYGGRVTDDWDRRCLMTILRKFYNPHVLDRKYQFSKAGEYYIQEYQNLENYKSYIDGLPLEDSTAIFGMHPNANISYLKQEER